MNCLETERLVLRPFTEDDAECLLAILGDKEVNTFLPMFPLQNTEETVEYLRAKQKDVEAGRLLCYHAICLKQDNKPVGYVQVCGDDSHDLGYGLKKEWWGKGICSEACRSILGELRRMKVPYVTATHDVHNPASGRVMQAIGMAYQYSYEELWQPKNIRVVFRMYQLNLDNEASEVYRKYWNQYPVHFVEQLPRTV